VDLCLVVGGLLTEVRAFYYPSPESSASSDVGGTFDRDDVICTNAAPSCRHAGPAGVGTSTNFDKRVFVSSDAIFDGGLFRFSERNLLEQP
jgi:hypothetical protein